MYTYIYVCIHMCVYIYIHTPPATTATTHDPHSTHKRMICSSTLSPPKDIPRMLSTRGPVEDIQHTTARVCILSSLSSPGWRRPPGTLSLQVIFRKKATNYGALVGK